MSVHYENCLLCPRLCGVNRNRGGRGFCGETSDLRIGFAGIHRGEEPPLAGSGGSGTIFVTGCNLGCVFCQNYQVSQGGLGAPVSPKEFTEICLILQGKGVININIVTGSHAGPALAEGIVAARKGGLSIPVLWNSSGYDGLETLELLEDIVDVYLPDLKTLDSGFAGEFYKAPDYPEHAAAAILKMMELKTLSFNQDQNRTMTSGVMIRHLVIPGRLDLTRGVLQWYTEHCKGRALLSLMTQYTPVYIPGRNVKIPGRFLSMSEYEAVLKMLSEFGIDDGFCQELVTGTDWLPDFNRRNPFSSGLSEPVWSNGKLL
ncbi:MAG: radical SAM protein [Treponema sp.]|nr:radical SAM protein [Treponema sp.]